MVYLRLARVSVIFFVSSIAMALPGFAQSTAQSVAAALQSWRGACGDPNPDLAMGYLAEAVGTNNLDVRKVCLREIMASDNRDLQSAALRQVISTLPFVRFRVTPVGDPGALYDQIKTGMLFHAANGNSDAGTATWLTTIQNMQPQEGVGGDVRVLGPGIVWAGSINYGNGIWKCKLAADLAGGAMLEGVLNCGSLGEFNASTNLLD